MPIFGGRGNDGEGGVSKKKLCGFPRGNHSDKNKVVPLFLETPISFRNYSKTAYDPLCPSLLNSTLFSLPASRGQAFYLQLLNPIPQ